MAPPHTSSHYAQDFVNVILEQPAWKLAAASVALGVLYLLCEAIYNIWFHPLAKYPGPLLARTSKIWLSYHTLNSRWPFKVKEMHDKYGPIVRTAPNILSFNTASSWKQIYGHVGGRKQFLKAPAYDVDAHTHLVSERDPIRHGKMRRILAHAFSAKALTEQEPYVHEYVDSLIEKINENATEKPKGENMVPWYNYCTFDIIGDLAFGEPFGSLQIGSYHFWVSTILDNIKAGLVLQVAGRWPLLRKYRKRIFPQKIIGARTRHLQYTSDAVEKRLATKTDRKDFMGMLFEQSEARELPRETIKMNASLLVVAGSETTATFLSGVSYYLCREKDAYRKLAEEVRGTFSSYDEITGHATDRLPYLKAVIDEGLRIYPPVPVGMPRVSPGETVDGEYLPEGTECYTTSWAATKNEKNFHDPYKFKPERWLDPECKDKKEASQPFMLGSRVCLGRNLALMEMRVILAKIFFAYDFELMDKDLDWDRDNTVYTLWNKPELKMNFTRRPGVVIPPLDGRV